MQPALLAAYIRWLPPAGLQLVSLSHAAAPGVHLPRLVDAGCVEGAAGGSGQSMRGSDNTCPLPLPAAYAPHKQCTYAALCAQQHAEAAWPWHGRPTSAAGNGMRGIAAAAAPHFAGAASNRHCIAANNSSTSTSISGDSSLHVERHACKATATTGHGGLGADETPPEEATALPYGTGEAGTSRPGKQHDGSIGKAGGGSSGSGCSKHGGRLSGRDVDAAGQGAPGQGAPSQGMPGQGAAGAPRRRSSARPWKRGEGATLPTWKHIIIRKRE